MKNKLDFTLLDQLYDQSLERLEKGKTSLTGAYAQGPLAEDHFLLTKSWAYFRSRIRTLEDQWKNILSSKEAETKALKKELSLVSQRLLELEEENKKVGALEEGFRKVELKDHVEFNRNAEKLRAAWMAEQEVLEKNISNLEYHLTQEKKESARQQEALKKEMEKRDLLIEDLKKGLSRSAEKNFFQQSEFTKTLSLRDEWISALESKVELLKTELTRRDQAIKRVGEEILSRGREMSSQEKEIRDLKTALLKQAQDHQNLSIQHDILKREKETLLLNWQRQQAEWRELWDRSRELWDKKNQG